MQSVGFVVSFNDEPKASFRYKGHVIEFDHTLSNPKLCFYRNANDPWGVSVKPESGITVVKNIEQAFLLIDQISSGQIVDHAA